VKIKSKAYIDGGILDNLPVKPLQKKCELIVGLNCNPVSENYTASSWKDVMERSLLLAIDPSTQQSGGKCHLFLEPPGLDIYKVFDFKKMQDIYDIGYAYAVEQREKILQFVGDTSYAEI
jgi:NTE family protein